VDAEELRTIQAENQALRQACRRWQEDSRRARERALAGQRRAAAALEGAVEREAARLRADQARI
jgi:hypothetical protein